jgi:5-methylcytosine-specific restriction protein B
LALVDLALRRRFAFVDLEPRFGPKWKDWVSRNYGIDTDFLNDVERRILSLNEQIAADRSLGRQFRLGHSYVTPPVGSQITDARRWFGHIVETEIGPLLEEYWFDAADKAREARQRLAEGL